MKILFLGQEALVKNNQGGAIYDPVDLIAYPKAIDRVSEFIKAGWTVFCISNQNGVADGCQTIDQAISIQSFLLKIFPGISSCYFCAENQGHGDYVFQVSLSGDRLIPTYELVPSPVEWYQLNFTLPSWLMPGIYSSLQIHRRNTGCLGYRLPEAGILYRITSQCSPNGWNPNQHNTLLVGDRPEYQSCAQYAGIRYLSAESWRENSLAHAEAIAS